MTERSIRDVKVCVEPWRLIALDSWSKTSNAHKPKNHKNSSKRSATGHHAGIVIIDGRVALIQAYYVKRTCSSSLQTPRPPLPTHSHCCSCSFYCMFRGEYYVNHHTRESEGGGWTEERITRRIGFGVYILNQFHSLACSIDRGSGGGGIVHIDSSATAVGCLNPHHGMLQYCPTATTTATTATLILLLLFRWLWCDANER